MKKNLVTLSAFIISLISILYLNQLFMFITAAVLKVNGTIGFSGVGLRVYLPELQQAGPAVMTLILLSPFIAGIIFIETAFLITGKTANNIVKNILIIYLLINAGYLILSVMMGVFSVVFKTPLSSEWAVYFSKGELNYDQKLLYLFMFILLLLGYINVLTKRIRKIIPVIMKKK